MCSVSCCPAAAPHRAFSSSVPSIISSPNRLSRISHVGSLLLPQLRSRERASKAPRVRRIRGFARPGGAGSEEEETSENGKTSGAAAAAAAVTDAASASAASKGFGASVRAGAAEKKKSKSPSPTIRRSAPQQPLLQSAPKKTPVSQVETAFVGSLTILFGLIFVEGLALAASGFLPEDWDNFLVNTIYPSFTPTVGLFLLAAAGYGVFKYLGLGPSKE